MRALPSKSPCEGGGEVALIFRQHLPPGPKMVRFQSFNGGETHIADARIENESTLSAEIPAHEKAEVVYLQLVCNGQVISQTEFEFYRTVTDDIAHMYHLLNNNMSQFFPTMGGMGQFGPTPQGGTGGGMHSIYGYGGGNVTNYAYMLLLGACKWGVSGFVHAILTLPNMVNLLIIPTPQGLPEDIAEANGHTELANHLTQIRKMYCERTPSDVQSRSAASSLEEQLTKMSNVEKASEGLLDAVMSEIKDIAKKCEVKKDGRTTEEVAKEEEPAKVEEPASSEVDELTENVSTLTLENTNLKRTLDALRREKVQLEHKILALEQDLEEAQDDTPRSLSVLRSDRLTRVGSPNMPHRSHLIRDYSILSDHGICVSFDEDVRMRRASSIFQSGQLELNPDSRHKSITVTVPGEMNIANSLIYETYHVITEDYPPADDCGPIFRYGDRIIEINGQSTRGLSSAHIDELLRKEDNMLTVIPKAKS